MLLQELEGVLLAVARAPAACPTYPSTQVSSDGEKSGTRDDTAIASNPADPSVSTLLPHTDSCSGFKDGRVSPLMNHNTTTATTPPAISMSHAPEEESALLPNVRFLASFKSRHPQQYPRFLQLLNEYDQGQRDSTSVTEAVSVLLADDTQLLRDYMHLVSEIDTSSAKLYGEQQYDSKQHNNHAATLPTSFIGQPEHVVRSLNYCCDTQEMVCRRANNLQLSDAGLNEGHALDSREEAKMQSNAKRLLTETRFIVSSSVMEHLKSQPPMLSSEQ